MINSATGYRNNLHKANFHQQIYRKRDNEHSTFTIVLYKGLGINITKEAKDL